MNLIDHRYAISRPQPPVGREAFVRWVEQQERRYELVGGRIVDMVNVSRNHARITTRLAMLLCERVAPLGFDVAIADFAVRLGPNMRFPDIVVDRAGLDGREHGTNAPIFIAEVLSPGSERADLVEKPREYGALETLATYAVLSQDEVQVSVWERGALWPEAPRRLEGDGAALDIPALGVVIPLADIYRGILI